MKPIRRRSEPWGSPHCAAWLYLAGYDDNQFAELDAHNSSTVKVESQGHQGRTTLTAGASRTIEAQGALQFGSANTDLAPAQIQAESYNGSDLEPGIVAQAKNFRQPWNTSIM
jgi:hypothetical protein